MVGKFEEFMGPLLTPPYTHIQSYLNIRTFDRCDPLIGSNSVVTSCIRSKLKTQHSKMTMTWNLPDCFLHSAAVVFVNGIILCTDLKLVSIETWKDARMILLVKVKFADKYLFYVFSITRWFFEISWSCVL